MGPETPLRIAGPADLAVVTDLIAGFRDFLEDDEPERAAIEAVVSNLLGDRATEYVLAGEPAAGFCQVRYRLSVWTGTDDAWIEDLFVEDDARGRGYGRMLVEAAIQSATARGCRRIQLDVNRDNAAALALYDKFGFAAIHNAGKWGDSPDLMMTRLLV